MERIPTGITGLDTILAGGFLKPSTVLVVGLAGSGKTTFTIQSLFTSAAKGEKSLYVTASSETIAMINHYMSAYSFFDPTFYEKELIIFADISSLVEENYLRIVPYIQTLIEKHDPSRIVLDPLTGMTYDLDEKEKRKFLRTLFTNIKGWNTFTIITEEMTHDQVKSSLVGYMADGIIELGIMETEEEVLRYLQIPKMRGTHHTMIKQHMEMGPDGLTVTGQLFGGRY